MNVEHQPSAVAFLNLTPPAFSTVISVPSNVIVRHVFWECQVTATALNTAQIDVYLNGNLNSLQVFLQPGGDTAARLYGASFPVNGGGSYQFINGGRAGTTETIKAYSYIDVI